MGNPLLRGGFQVSEGRYEPQSRSSNIPGDDRGHVPLPCPPPPKDLQVEARHACLNNMQAITLWHPTLPPQMRTIT